MRVVVWLTLALVATTAHAQETETVLPRRGNLVDVLTCAGTNQVFHALALKKAPDDRRTLEAGRKASWYRAVALSVFQVDVSQVFAAVKEAQVHEPRVEVIDTALKCRDAPTGWSD